MEVACRVADEETVEIVTVGLRKPGPYEDIGKDLVHTLLLDNKVFLLLIQ